MPSARRPIRCRHTSMRAQSPPALPTRATPARAHSTPAPATPRAVLLHRACQPGAAQPDDAAGQRARWQGGSLAEFRAAQARAQPLARAQARAYAHCGGYPRAGRRAERGLFQDVRRSQEPPTALAPAMPDVCLQCAAETSTASSRQYCAPCTLHARRSRLSGRSDWRTNRGAWTARSRSGRSSTCPRAWVQAGAEASACPQAWALATLLAPDF